MNGMGNDLVREARRRAGLTAREFAERAGITVNAVALLESGRTSPPFDDIVRYLRLMGLDLDFMLVERDESDWSQTVPLLALTPGQRFDRHERWVAATADMRTEFTRKPPALPLCTETVLEFLVGGDVSFVIIGGYASVLHGAPYMMHELDISVPADDVNCHRLSRVLEQIPDIERSRVHSSNDGFEDCYGDSEVVALREFEVRVASLADVIRISQISNQPLDQRVLPTLREILASRNPRNRSDG